MKNTELYDQLDVSSDATDEEIKSAYKKKSSELHPDKKNGNVEAFKEMKLAYEVLKDPDSREYYDVHGKSKDKKQDPEKMAVSIILTHVNNWLLSGNIDSDLVQFIKSKLKYEISDIQESIKRGNTSKEKVEKIKDRITSKKDNFILGFFNKTIRDIDEIIANQEIQKETLELAIIIMKDFSWEKIEEMESYVTITNTSSVWRTI